VSDDWVNGYDAEASGAVILDDARKFIRRFCVFPDLHCLTAVTLWAAHTHIVEHFYTTPRLALVSPEPESGKTRVLEVLDLLVPNPMLAFSASPAAIFRTLAEGTLTLLFDEIDTIWSARGQDDNHEDLRALLGRHRRDAQHHPHAQHHHQDAPQGRERARRAIPVAPARTRGPQAARSSSSMGRRDRHRSWRRVADDADGGR
jgi:hypothetical protein